MRSSALVAAIALIAAAPAQAEIARLHGRVIATDGSPVAGATIAAAGATAIADDDGSFSLEGVAPGSGLLVVADGYLPAVVTVTDTGTVGVIALVPDDASAIPGEVIEISGDAPDAGLSTRYALSIEQIRALPAAGNDALRALQILPGVARTAYGLGGMVLRGADPHDSRVYLDGIEIPLAFHVGGMTSVVPSTLLDAVEIAPGGGEVARGRSVGGVVEMRSRAPRTDRLRVGAEASLFDAAVHGEGPTWSGGGVAIGLRRSYVDAILAEVLAPDDRFLPRYHDAQLRWDQPLGRGVLSAIGLVSDDRVHRGDDLAVRQRFARAGLRYQRRAGATTVTALAWLGVRDLEMTAAAGTRPPSSLPNGNEDGDDADDGLDDRFRLRLHTRPLGARADLRRDTAWGHLAAGVDAAVHTEQRLVVEGDLGMATEIGALAPPAATELAAWVEARWRVADGRLGLTPGARVEHLTASDEWLVEPRVVASHELAPWLTLRESLGLHHQPAALGRSDARGARPPAARAVHASIGADLTLPSGIAASVAAYHADVTGPRPAPDDMHSVDDGLDALFGVVAANLAGDALGSDDGRFRSRGVELMLRRETERSLLWLSYTRASSQHHAGPGARWIQTALDQTHNLGAVASLRLGRWRLGARLRYATGVPYTPKTFVRDDAGDWRPELGPLRSRRLPDFVSLDLRVDRAWPRSWGTVAAYVEAWNATDAHNVEAVVIDQDGEHFVRGLPLLPMLGLSLVPR